MSKKKSTYTDQTHPPYFRLDAPQYRTYFTRAEQRVKDLIAASPFVTRYTTAADGGQALTRAVAHQPNPDPPEHYDPDANFDADFDNETEPPADRYEPFRTLTAGWAALDIGPVRTLYHFDLFASTAFSEDVMDSGGFPRSPHATIPRRVGSFGDILSPPDHGRDWLIYDLFLGDALANLGLTWKVIEEAMTAAFLAALPSVYPPLLTAANVPRALSFLLWRHDLEHWRFFRVHGAAIEREAAKMSRLLWKTPDGSEFAPILASLGRRAKPAPWTQPVMGAEKLADELQERTKNSSPIIKVVNRALDAALWGGISDKPIKPTAPDFVKHIWKHKIEVNGQRTDEYRMLLADILFHLPIVRGLPPLRRYQDASSKQFPAQSDEAVRKSLGPVNNTANVSQAAAEKKLPDFTAQGKTPASRVR